MQVAMSAASDKVTLQQEALPGPTPQAENGRSLAAGRRPGTPRKLLPLAAQNRGHRKSARAQGARDLARAVRVQPGHGDPRAPPHDGVRMQG